MPASLTLNTIWSILAREVNSKLGVQVLNIKLILNSQGHEMCHILISHVVFSQHTVLATRLNFLFLHLSNLYFDHCNYDSIYHVMFDI